MHDGIMWVDTKSGWRICVPEVENLRSKVLHECHDTRLVGHPGVDKTLASVRRYFWWPTIDTDVRSYVEACHACRRGKSSNQKSGGLLQPLPVPQGPWQDISLDFIVALPKSYAGNDAILTVVDRFSKMAHFIPCRQNVTAKQTAQLLVREVVRLHGVPVSIVSDRDPRFTSS
ncbi:transposon tf2-1, partial [Cystoisospora suis]